MKHQNEVLHSSGHQRLMRLYSALIACDHSIIRSRNQADLFDEICRHIVHLCDVDVAWIGMVDTDGRRIWPQAHCGEGWNYFEWIKLTVDIDNLPGQGPAGLALAQNRAIWSHDLQHDSAMAGMQDLAREQGWHAVGVLPLCVKGAAAGVLSLYAKSGQVFDPHEQALLLQLASNISYALDVFHLEAQRAQAEYALQESEVRYSALFASNCMPMMVIDPTDGRIVDANIKAVEFYGWPPEVLQTMHVMDINVMSPEDVRREMAQAIHARKSHFDFQHRLASGEVRHVEVFSSPISFGGQTYLISAIHDVTERQHLETRIQSANALMQRFIDQLPGTAFVKDSQLRILRVNDRLAKMLNRDAGSLIGKTAQDIFPPAFAQQVTRMDRQMLEQGGSHTFVESLNGRQYEVSLFVIEDTPGERFLGGISLDVTDRFRSSERAHALLQLNELGSRLPETEFLTTGLELVEGVTRSKLGFLHFVNPDQQTLELVTWTANALKGCTAVADSHYPVDQAGIWADALRRREPLVCNDYANHAGRGGLPDGHVKLSRVVSIPVIENDLVRMILGVGNKDEDYDAVDVDSLQLFGADMWRIVQRARAEASLKQRVDELMLANQKLSQIQLQLLQSEKMASIGQLAAGVAHEINNPISFVKSNITSLKGYVGSLLEVVNAYEALESHWGDAAHQPALAALHARKQALDFDFLLGDMAQLLDESVEGVERVSKIVLDLKNFSRSGDTQTEWCDLHAGLESTINVVWNQLKYKVQLHREYGALPQIRCVPSQINQVVMNLLTNAEQAITGKGNITVRTGAQADQVWLEVEDDGCGIAPDKIERIFEPFYTSKPVGQGTGLGLSIAFGIVQRHGGQITVRSVPGRGSTFRVTLPVDASAVDHASPQDGRSL